MDYTKELETLRETLIVNSSIDFETHYDVTIKLIEIMMNQQYEIQQLKNRIINNS